MRRVPILAKNNHLLRVYLKEHNLNPAHFDYITGESSIRGRSGVILALGKWWLNPNYRNEWFEECLRSMVTSNIVSLIPVKVDLS